MRKCLLWILVASTTLFAADKRSFETWRQALGGADSSQYSSLKQITKANVKQLKVAWTYPVGGGALVFNPIVVDQTMYVAKQGSIVALDAATGKEIWAHANMGGIGARGINYWESRDRSDRRLVFMNAGFLTQINAKTGETVASFGDNGRVDLRTDLDRDPASVRPLQTSNPGRIFEDIIIQPLPAGGSSYESTAADIHAYDVRNGKALWVFHTVPRPGEFGYDTWPKDLYKTSGGVHNWNEMTVDEERGIAYIPLGTARYDFYGGNRKGDNLFANSLVALDARTGKRLWHFQMVHHDLWDYDLPTAPKLLTVRNNGRNVDIVAQPTKFGHLYVFDRVTGKPLWPIEERPVPKSDVPGEEASPTQPIPTKPPPFARQSFTEKDINPFIPDAEQQALREAFKNYRNEGLFTPPSLRGSIEMPGHNGGTNWGRSAVDPTKGTMYVVSNEQPTLMALVDPGAPRGGGGRGGGVPCPPATAAPGAVTAVPGAGGLAPAAPRGTAAGAPGPAQAAPGARGAPGGRGAAPAARGAAPAPVTPPVSDFTRYNSPINFMTSTCTGLSLIGPPWSQLTAYDLNSGTILWQVPHGEVTALARQGKTGLGSQAPRGGVVVTAGGLVFAGTSSDRKFHAYDQDTGKVVWEVELPAASEGVPAVYQVNGQEYIAIAVGGNGYLTQPRIATDPPVPAPEPSAYMVFALPKK